MSSKYYKIMAILVAVGGLIFGIVVGAITKSDNRGNFNAGLMIQSWIIADIFSMILFGIGSVLEYLESIKKSIDDCLHQKSVSSASPVSPIGNEWKCPKCGRINQSYVGSCGCGEQKPNIS